MKSRIVLTLLLLTSLITANNVLASPGQLDIDGCHFNQQEQYHCHHGARGGNLTLGHEKRKSEAAFRRFITEQKHVVEHKAPEFNAREWFGWIDADGDCQNTANEVLAFFSRIPAVFKTTKQCVVKSGKWLDQYTALPYRKAHVLAIDHIVSAKHAHLFGGAHWDRSQKQAFINDPLNLLPVHKESKALKAGQGPLNWMPPNTKFHCIYLKQWLKVKNKYHLVLTNDERVFIKYRMQDC